MDCKTCKENAAHVPFRTHEADMARQERTIRRLWIALLVMIFLFAGSNLAWTIYENQFEDVVMSQEVEQNADGDGINHFVGGDYYGDTESQNNG